MRWGLLILVVLLPSVSALSLVQEYHEGNALLLAPGATHQHRIDIVNPEDVPVRVEISVSGPGMHIDGTDRIVVEVPPRSSNTFFEVTITVPADAEPGTTFEGRVSVRLLVDAESSIVLGYRMHDQFMVRVIPPARGFSPVTGAISASAERGWSFLASNGILLTFVLAFIVVVLVFLITRQEMTTQSPPRAPLVPQDAFVSANGFATTFEELATLIDGMTAEQFHEHRTRNGNEFANWVYYKTQDRARYHATLHAQTKPEIIAALLRR